MPSTITLLQIANQARTRVELLPVADVGGFTGEPALSICNDVIQDLLSYPRDFKFNRVEMPMLVTAPYRQDNQFAGATAFVLGANSRGAGIGLAATPAITETGNTVTVNTLDPHNFLVGDTVYMTGNTVPAYNSTFTQTDQSSLWSGGWAILSTPTPTSFTFTHVSTGLGPSGAPGITDYGWLSSGTMVEMNNTSSPQNIRQLETMFDLKPTSRSSTPEKVCVIQDLGTGILRIRFVNVPGSVTWGAKLVYQAKAPLKTNTALSDTWAPFPDEYSYVYRQGFLAHAYNYVNSPKFQIEDQKFQRAISKALVQGDREEEDIHLYPEGSILIDTGFGGSL